MRLTLCFDVKLFAVAGRQLAFKRFAGRIVHLVLLFGVGAATNGHYVNLSVTYSAEQNLTEHLK